MQGHVSLGYTSVAKAGHVRGINLQVEKGGEEEKIVHEREINARSKNYYYAWRSRLSLRCRCPNVREIFFHLRKLFLFN